MRDISIAILTLLILVLLGFSLLENDEPPAAEPDLTFDAEVSSGAYEKDGEICLVCYGVELRCGDDITREDLLSMVKYLMHGETWSLCEEEAKTMNGTWQNFGLIPFAEKTK